MASFCLVFGAKNPVKFDKLAFIEGKNEMFLNSGALAREARHPRIW